MLTVRAGVAVLLVLAVWGAWQSECAMACQHTCCRQCGQQQPVITAASSQAPAAPPEWRAWAPAAENARPVSLKPVLLRVPPDNGPPAANDFSSLTVLRI